MARVRFPGRPGHRFEQIRVAYFNDDIKNYQDPCLAFLPQFRHGLRTFYELVGASDEDEEFEGFSSQDVQESESKLEEIEQEIKKEEKKKEEQMVDLHQIPSTRLARVKKLQENQPSAFRTRKKVKAVVKKSHDDMLKEGFKSPDNSHCVVSMTPLTAFPRNKASSLKVKSKKLNFGTKAEHKAEVQNFAPKAKKTEMDMAKFLLEKAKQANILQQQAKAKRLAALSSNKVIQRREFVLPSQSSRSSRVIIPNKRFLEDDSMTSPILKKKKSLENDSSTQLLLDDMKSPTKMDGTMASPVKSDSLGNKSIGSLDKPLIIAGKRDRKPSVKVLEKIVDNSARSSMGFRYITSPIAAPKLGKDLFPSFTGPPTTFQKASESQKLVMFGSTRKQGASIVQKAKLQLNRAALNKSKAALARSLKAEMKREAKIAETEKMSHDILAEEADLQTELAVVERPTPSRKKQTCIVCGAKGKSKPGSWKTDIVWCYKKFYACQACLSFIAKSRYRAKMNMRYKCDGNDPGNCKFSNRCRMCRLCRVMRVIQLGFPYADVLQHLVQKKPEKSKPKPKVTPVKSIRKSMESTEAKQQEPIVRLYSVDSQMSGRKSTMKAEIHTPLKDEIEDNDLTPPKDGWDQRRRRRSSKEPLKSPIDKGKIVSKDLDPEPSTSLIVPVEGSVVETSQSTSHGPRIKHVCRNAAVVLGKTPATFPEKSEFRLSALPNKDKVEIWKQEEEVKAATSVDSDDDRPMEEIIEKSADGNTIVVKKAFHLEPKEKRLKKLMGPGGMKVYKKKRRCKQCPGCLRTDCGKCKFCLDMPKFGGRGTIRQACVDKPKFGGRGTVKQACEQRKCENPLIQRCATAAFIQPKTTPVQVDTDTESNTDSVHSSPAKTSSNIPRQIERPRELVVESELEMTKKTSTPVPISINESECQTLNDNVASEQPSAKQDTSSSNNKKDEKSHQVTVSVPFARASEQVCQNEPRSEVRRLQFDSGTDHRLENLASKRVGKIRSKVKEKVEIQQKYAKNPGNNNNNNNQCFPVTLVDPASRQWGHASSQPRYHPIRVDYKGKCDVNNAWSYGIAVTMSSAMSVRTLCFLCASSGKHELVFCNVCCEPFHKFCLEEFEQPVKGHDADWCCARCQFCSVCGRQNNLLQCDKCQNMYHPECLGPNYPTKPTKEKNIWICTKCVKCKSCGATTPGVTSDATWTYDFSLCYECGKLMDKGNFCPICRKCYSDDDWESKMIQCNTCESWVHSNCEGLTDEMYEILSYLPEDLSFYCQRCSHEGCPQWLGVLREELRLGLENIMQTLILSKCAQYIIKRETMAPPQKQICDKEKLEKQQQQSITDSDDHVHDKLPTNETLQTESSTFTDKSKSHLEESKQTDSNISIVAKNRQEKLGEMIKKSENQSTLDNKVFTDVHISKSEEIISISRTNLIENQENHQRTHVDCDKSIRTEKSNLRIGQNDERTGDSVGKGVKLSGLKVCDTIKNFVEGDEGNGEGADKSFKSCGFYKPCKVNDLNVLTKSCGISTDISKHSENVGGIGSQIDDIKNEPVVIKAPEVDKASETGEMKKCVDVSNEKDNCKVVMIKTPPGTAPAKHHVHFNIAGNKVVEPVDVTDKPLDPEYPKDLMEIAEKMKTGFYKSVALFCEDILRIIQEYLDNDEEIRISRKKSIQSAKAVFVKQMEKRFPWFQVKQCRYWYSSKNIPDGMLPDATLPPTIDHTYAQWLHRTELPKSPQPSPFKYTQTPIKKYVPYDEEEGEMRTFLEGEDTRRCMFCLQFGDQDPNDAGRLLFCGQDDWAHINCALWSAEVYEDVNGALRNLVEAYSRGKMLKCDLCGLSGATVGCNTKGCSSNYHFMCARDDYCRFQEDKKVFCKYHIYRVDGELLTRERFGVYRRVYVDCLNVRTVKKHWAKGLNSIDINVLIGSCCVEALGRLTDLSDKPRFLQPVDFISTRIFWSTKDARRRCVYTCRIVEVRPQMTNSPIVELKDTRIVHDENHPEFIPFSQLDLGSLNLSHLKSNRSTSESFVVDLTHDESTVSAIEGNSCSFGDLTQCKSLENTNDEISVGRSMSFSGVSNVKESYKKDTLSKSWGGLELSKIQKPVKLKGLSPQTLRLLNIKDPQKETSNPSVNDNEKDDDFSLLKIADRLNSAAAKSSKHFNLHSREGSQSPLTAPQMNCVHRNRSRSLDSVPSIPYIPSLPTVKETGPAFAWTPPTRLSSRANSWPKERQTYVSLLNKSILRPDQNRTCELMDIDPISEPIDASSPKCSGQSSVNVNPETSHAEKMETSMETSQCIADDTAKMETDGDEKLTELQVEASTEDIPEATFVVMTDTSEEISEEEAIKIVQEALSGNSDILDSDSNKTDGDKNKDCEVLCTDTGLENHNRTESPEVQSEGNKNNFNEQKDDSIDDAKTNNIDDKCENNERSDSPFIPQFVSPSNLSKKPINRTEVMEPDVEKDLSNSDRTIKDTVTICDDSDCDSDVLDITDSVYNMQENKMAEVSVSGMGYEISKVKESTESLDTDQAEEGIARSNNETKSPVKGEPEEPKLKGDIVNEDEVDGDQSVESANLISSMTDSEQHLIQNNVSSLDDDVKISNLTEVDNHSSIALNTNETEGNNEHVEDIDPQKKQVLRGLGLGTNDEVEQIKKNSPTKPSTCFNTLTAQDCKRHKKPKYSPIKVKKYPLRRKTVSPIKYLGNRSFSNETNETIKTRKSPINKIHASDKEELKEDNVEKKSELPVLDPIAKKIKEESLAKSCPEEKGPFKCQTCRRMYRTETSYEIHVKNCTFYVSSSDEDSESSKGLTEDSGSEKPQYKKLSKDKDIESDTKDDESEQMETFTRSSLRKSTMNQRVAIEVEERRLKEEALNVKSLKKPSKKSTPKLDGKEIEDKEQSVENDNKVDRRVTRRSGGDAKQMLSLEMLGDKRRVSEKKTKDLKEGKIDGINTSCSQENPQLRSPGGRRGLRRQIHHSSDSDTEPSSEKVIKLDENSSQGRKVRNRSSSNAEEMHKNSPIHKRRTRSSTNKREDSADIFVLSDNDSDIGLKAKHSEESVNSDSQTTLDKSTVSVSSKEGCDPILDYVSGLIVDPKTGIIYSPSKKVKTAVSNVDKEDVGSDGEKSEGCVNEEGIDNEDENANCVNNSIKDETEMDSDQKVMKNHDTHVVDNKHTSPESVDDSGKTLDKSVVHSFDSEKKTCEKVVGVINTNDTKETDKVQKSKSDCDNTKQGPGKMVSLENSQDIPKAELSKTVLQLLKKGHKVLIKNPTSDKSYVWEKTASGYVGRPLDTDMHSPIGRSLNKGSHTLDSSEAMSDVKDKTHESFGKPLLSPECERDIQKTLSSPDSFKEVSKALVSPACTIKEAKKPLTASEILANKKKARDKEGTTGEQLNAKETQEKVVNALNEKANLDQGISNVRHVRPIAPAAPAGTEYLGGILFSKKPDHTPTDLKLRSTAQLASAALQSSLQIKNDMGASVREVYRVTGNNQSLVQFLSPNSLRQPTLRHPILYQNIIPSLSGQPSSIVQPVSFLSQTYGFNSSINQIPMLTPQILQQSTIQGNSLNLNNSTMTGTSVTQTIPNILKKINEPIAILNKEIRPKVPHSTSSHPLSSNESVKNHEPTAKDSIESIEKLKMTRIENFKKKMESLIKQPPCKPIVRASLRPGPKSPLKDHKLYFKKQTFKKYKRKQIYKPRSPLKARKPSAIGSPRAAAKASHPIIHPQKENLHLPIAAVEEEIQDIPLSTMMELENFQGGHDKTGQSLGHLEFEITSDDGFSCKADTLDGAWKQVIEKVQDVREANRFKQLSYTGLSGIEMFGLSHPNIVYLLEQLSGAGYCRKYQFKYHKHEPTEQEVELLNPSGCIRSEPFSGRNPWDMFSFLMSRYRQLPERTHQGGDEEMVQKSSRRATSMDLPMAMRFRKLKAFSRECVGVYRSHIHGRGLFCKRNIDAGEMIIEYAGEVIRNSMTDNREMYYESKGIGCYMFRIDDEFVVDATMKGSAARFINHSCEPNCYSKVITVDNRKHIVIFALRQIYRGEELTYDYKFPIEEVKIPCTCGAQRCRKYLN